MIASPHQAFPLKKRRSISQFCSLVAKRIGMICCQFSNPVFTLLGKIKWVQVFHDMSSLSCYFVKINISLNQSCMVKYTWSGTPRCAQNSLNGVVPIVLQKNMILHKKPLWKKEKIVKIWSKIAIFFSSATLYYIFSEKKIVIAITKWKSKLSILIFKMYWKFVYESKYLKNLENWKLKFVLSCESEK